MELLEAISEITLDVLIHSGTSDKTPYKTQVICLVVFFTIISALLGFIIFLGICFLEKSLILGVFTLALSAFFLVLIIKKIIKTSKLITVNKNKNIK